MSQIEQDFRVFLSKNPEIENCYQQGLINRRSLARFLIENKIAKSNQTDAVIAMLRRFDFKNIKPEKSDLFKDIKINVKDNILILDFEKNKELIKNLSTIITNTNYEKGQTLKIVIGSSTVKIFIDKENKDLVTNIISNFKLSEEHKNISELSITFPKNAIKTKGLLSTVTKQLSLNNIIISELLTASPELLIYLNEEYILKAYEIIKRLKNS
jgi:hypothetical protein